MKPSTQSELLLAFSLLNSRISKKIDNCLGIIGISYTEFQILHNLSMAPNQSMSRVQLAESISLSASGITRLLAPMEKTGLVEKESNPRDARMSLVKLARGGGRIHKDAAVMFDQVTESITSKLSSRQLDTLLKHIRIML